MDFLQPTVAIVTRTSRSAVFLERVLDGLQKQTGAKLVWSIVTQQALTPAHHKCLDRARLLGIDVSIKNARPGEKLGKLANIGVNAVESTYVLLHDDDDAFNRDFIGPALTIFTQQSCVAVAGHAAFIQETSNKQSLDFILSPGKRSVCLSELVTDNLIVVHGLIYSRTAYEVVGGYNEEVSVAEDWLFNIKLRKFGNIEIFNRVCANVYIRKDTNGNKTKPHTDNRKHLQMREIIRTNEGAKNNVQLEIRTSSLQQKTRRRLDRLIFKLTGKFLPR